MIPSRPMTAAGRFGRMGSSDESIVVGPPVRGDGARMHDLADRAGGLDVNSPYAYVLWVRDFAATTAVAREGDEVLAYCLGYLRPEAPGTYFVWQIAVDPAARGQGLALRLLEEVVERCGASDLEATVTPANAPSRRLFASFAAKRGATLTFEDLFEVGDFPDAHEPEQLLRVGPVRS